VSSRDLTPDIGALYREHGSAICALLVRLGVDESEIEDLAQDVFLVAAQMPQEVPTDPRTAKRWLCDVTRKLTANWRRLYRHEYEEFDLEDWPDVMAEPADPMEHNALCDLVRRTLCRLPPQDHEILVRHHLDGESYKELGVIFGLTKSGAHVRVEHAAEQFRRRLYRLGRR
jgi:RNA polymerase sigma-70 factor, ECF subfamily